MSAEESDSVRLDNLVIGHGRHRVAGPLSFTFALGDFAVITGPNGCGKSTLIRTIAGLVKPLGGRIHIRRHLVFGYVPQNSSLDPSFPVTVREVVAMPLHKRRERRQGASRLRDAMESTGVLSLEKKQFFCLSGGQQQRVLVARSIICQPNFLIMDEPTSAVDREGSKDIWKLMRSLAGQSRTIVVVSHDQVRAQEFATHKLELRNGKLIQAKSMIHHE